MKQFLLVFVVAVLGGVGVVFGVGSTCPGIECEEPPNIGCLIVKEEDKSFPRPVGKNVECCPLWVCPGGNHGAYYTFHGVKPGHKNEVDDGIDYKHKGKFTIDFKGNGGSETVHYSRDRSMVSSSATGDHASVASSCAGHSCDKAADDALSLIQDALKDVGIGGLGL